MKSAPKLTALSSCAGCAAKLGQAALGGLLDRLPQWPDRNLLVGSGTADDAGVYRLNARQALVQTVDFFTPIVDDPFLYGQIAATNALSDVYAMGGRPLTALALLGVPADRLEPAAIREILRGGALKAREARCVMAGGHTIRLPEPVYGLSVTGLVHPRRLITNAAARPGDVLVLTKPLGTGIITTGIKRGLAGAAAVRRAVQSMRRLNIVGADLAERGLVKAGTDVTGFGLLGHLGSMCRASGVAAEVFVDRLPVLSPEVWELLDRDCIPGGTRTNLATAESMLETGDGVSARQRLLAADAQTSGGLLLAVAPRHLVAVLDCLKEARTLSRAVVGRIEASRRPRIRLSAGTPG